MGGLLHNKTVGIIGFGAIGQRVGELAKAFGCEVGYYDPQPVSVPWARKMSLPQLLAEADIIPLHASGKKLILGAEDLILSGIQVFSGEYRTAGRIDPW